MKVINNFNINTSPLSSLGENRPFSISGSPNAVFSLEITNEDGNYYDFKTELFSGTKTGNTKLKNKVLVGGTFNGNIKFPAVGDDDHYDFYLFAEGAFNTEHRDYKEVRFDDNSVDINSSIGSDSSLIRKRIIQYSTAAALTLTAHSPNSLATWGSVSIATDSITGPRHGGLVKQYFQIRVSAAATRAIQIDRQPIENDISTFVTRNIGAPDASFAGEVGDALEDGYYKWAIKSDSSIHGLTQGMPVTGTNVTALSQLAEFKESITYTYEVPKEILDEVDEEGNVIGKVKKEDSDYADLPAKTKTVTTIITQASGVDPEGFAPTYTDGVVTKQLGSITFNKKQVEVLTDDTGVKFWAYGPQDISRLTKTKVKLSDLKVELTAPTTTTTSAVNNSVTIPVADREGTIVNVSTISGIGIDSTAVNPTIASATADGAGNWTASAAQTLESGTTLTVGGTGRVVIISGYIEVKEFGNGDGHDGAVTLYFDLERFLTAA